MEMGNNIFFLVVQEKYNNVNERNYTFCILKKLFFFFFMGTLFPFNTPRFNFSLIPNNKINWYKTIIT